MSGARRVGPYQGKALPLPVALRLQHIHTRHHHWLRPPHITGSARLTSLAPPASHPEASSSSLNALLHITVVDSVKNVYSTDVRAPH